MCNQLVIGDEVQVHCSKQLPLNHCFVSDQVILKINDKLVFTDMDYDHRFNIIEFNTTIDSKIEFIPFGIFNTFPNLEHFTLSNGLRQINYDDFIYAHNLFNLTLSDNKIEHITSSVFSLAKNLAEINLDGNEILYLDNDAFNGLDKLYLLSMANNRIATIKSHVFIGAPYLTDLRLDYNEIDTIELNAFDLPNLLFLNLAHNQIKQLPNNIFNVAPILWLNLDGNQLMHLGESIYGMKHVRKLILIFNPNIDDIDEEKFDQMKSHLINVTYDSSLSRL